MEVAHLGCRTQINLQLLPKVEEVSAGTMRPTIGSSSSCFTVYMLRSLVVFMALAGAALFGVIDVCDGQDTPGHGIVHLPSSKLLLNPLPGEPQSANSFPTAVALSPDGRYLALLNDGRGTAESGYQQSIGVLDVQTNRLSDYPDSRFKVYARQTYFLGLAFSGDGKRLYASVASLTTSPRLGPCARFRRQDCACPRMFRSSDSTTSI